MRALTILFVSATTAVAQTTWIVDDTPGPGVQFTSLPAAVAAAASGDTLLVAAGSYEPFHVTGKALTIRGAGSSATVIDQPAPVAGNVYVAVDAVPAGAVFRLSGVHVQRRHPQRLVLRGSGPATGAIVLAGVVSDVPATGSTSFDGPGLLIDNVLVHAYHCAFVGGSSVAFGTLASWGHTAVHVEAAAVFIAEDCVVEGGSGFALLSSSGALAGDGLVVDGATCRLSRCIVRGGQANALTLGSTLYPGDGLTALGSASVTVAGSSADVIAGGQPGAGAIVTGSGIICSPNAAVMVHGPVTITSSAPFIPPTSGSSITLGLQPLPHLRFDGAPLANGSLPAAQPITLSLDGAPPGQLFVLLVDVRPAATAIAGLSPEPLLLSGTAAFAGFGLLNANGAYTLTATPTVQLPYVIGLETHWQGFVWHPALASWRGSNAALLRVEL